jgi:NAD(P)-dependent dehydrogenase (short-subunit alcohol dehydrogenase family)
MAVGDVSDHSIAELISLEGRSAVVTGAGGGIGRAIAERLAEAGAAVLIGDVDRVAAEDVAAILRRRGCDAIGMASDVSDEGAVGALGDRAVVEWGHVDVWVNNAGIFPTAPVLEMTGAQWDSVLDLNLRGTFLGAREAARRMVGSGRAGVIVNLASTAGVRAPGSGVAHYVASKFGVRGLTKALAVELGPYGIRVLAVAPTYVDTPGTRESRAAFEVAAGGDMLKQIGASKPLGRVGVPDDVARVVLFCASDLAMLMTGSTLSVDAGELAL